MSSSAIVIDDDDHDVIILSDDENNEVGVLSQGKTLITNPFFSIFDGIYACSRNRSSTPSTCSFCYLWNAAEHF